MNLTGAFSYLKTEITGGSRALNPYSKQMTEDSLPKVRGTVSGSYKIGGLEVTGRARYYGEWSDWTDTFPATAAPSAAYPTFAPQTFKPITFMDLIVSYDVTKGVKLQVGAENILDTYPDKAKYQTFRGLIYSRNSPYSTDGGYYYTKIEVNF